MPDYKVLILLSDPKGEYIDSTLNLDFQNDGEANAFSAGVSCGAGYFGDGASAVGTFNRDEWPEEIVKEIEAELKEPNA